MRIFGLVVMTRKQFDYRDERYDAVLNAFNELANRCSERLNKLNAIAAAGPLTREQILNGLAKGMDDPAVKSVVAIVKGLRELAVRDLASTGLMKDTAEILRGKLALCNEVEQMLGTCWADMERVRKAGSKE